MANYWAVKHNGAWGVRKEGDAGLDSEHGTQAAAWSEAKRRAREDKGEAFLQGEDGRIRERNTYGADPRDIRG